MRASRWTESYLGAGERLRALLPFTLRGVTILIALVMLIPIIFVVVQTVATGWQTSYQLIVRPRVGELLFNTVRLVVGTVITCGLIGLVAAWLTERSNLPWPAFWRILLVAPIAVPSFVNGFTWISLSGRFEGFAGAVMIMTLSHFTFVYLPVAAAFRGLDPAYEETSRALGNGPWRTFWLITLPQLRTALLGGLLIVLLHLLAELGALEMLRFPTFTTAIYDQFASTFNSAAANSLASVLVLLCLLALLAENRLRGRARYARIGAGTPRPATPVRLKLLVIPTVAGLSLLSILALGVPIATLVFWMVTGTSTTFPLDRLAATTFNSVRLGLIGALVTLLVALPVAWLAVRRPGPLSTLTERAAYVSYALPGIVVALALIATTIRYARPLYQSTVMLILAYVILLLPLALVAIRAALTQVPPVLDDVGRSLGATPGAVLRRVTLPLIAPGLGAGAALIFISITTELTATLLLAPIGTETLATRFWSHAEAIQYGAAAPYAGLIVIISAPMTYLLTRQFARIGRS